MVVSASKKKDRRIMKEVKTINDLPKNISLGGIKFIHPETKEVCIWSGQWNQGVWYKKDINSSQIFPLFVDNLEDCLKFEIVEQ
jgi:hypothetical protein